MQTSSQGSHNRTGHLHRDFVRTFRLKAGPLSETPRKRRAGAEARAGPRTAGGGPVQIALQRRTPLYHRGKYAVRRTSRIGSIVLTKKERIDSRASEMVVASSPLKDAMAAGKACARQIETQQVDFNACDVISSVVPFHRINMRDPKERSKEAKKQKKATQKGKQPQLQPSPYQPSVALALALSLSLSLSLSPWPRLQLQPALAIDLRLLPCFLLVLLLVLLVLFLLVCSARFARSGMCRRDPASRASEP
jgi:hypothetical protein